MVFLLLVPNVFVRPREAQKIADTMKSRFAHSAGDHLTLLNVFHAFLQNRMYILFFLIYFDFIILVYFVIFCLSHNYMCIFLFWLIIFVFFIIFVIIYLLSIKTFYYFIAEDNQTFAYDNFLHQRNLRSAVSVRQQLARLMTKFDLPLLSTEFSSKDHFTNIQKCLLSGFFMQVAHLSPNGQYLTAKDNQVFILFYLSILFFSISLFFSLFF